MSEKLKPCPFCGQDVKVWSATFGKSTEYRVLCPTCGISTEDDNDRNSVVAKWNTRPAEKILPIPCTKFQGATVKEWFAKINEELDELKTEILRCGDISDKLANMCEWPPCILKFTGCRDIAEEAADTVTVITSMLQAMGIDEEMRQKAQKEVNEKNKRRGYYGEV